MHTHKKYIRKFIQITYSDKEKNFEIYKHNQIRIKNIYLKNFKDNKITQNYKQNYLYNFVIINFNYIFFKYVTS